MTQNIFKYVCSCIVLVQLSIHFAYSQKPSSDTRQALIDFYHDNNGENWTYPSEYRRWQIDDPNSNINNWYGVTKLTNSINLRLNSTYHNLSSDSLNLSALVNINVGWLTIIDMDINEIIKSSMLTRLVLSTSADNTELILNSSDLSNLHTFHFDGLNKDYSNVDFLDILKDYDQLTTLELNNINLCNINGLKNLTFLNELKLSDISCLENVFPLFNLKDLTTLEILRCSDLTNISSLSNLSDLTTLIISGCYKLSNISALSGLVNLLELNISNNNISNLLPLIGLKSLTKLNAWSNGITNISSLSS